MTEGTMIGPDQIAVIVAPDGRFNILIPDGDEAHVPESAQALIAAAMRLTSDPEFYKEMLALFRRQRLDG